MRHPIRPKILVPCAVLTLVSAAACSDGECDAGKLRELLAGASPGDTVLAGSCELTGPFTVPAGVRFDGSGQGDTVIVAPEGGVAVTLEPNASGPFTSLSDMTIRSDGCAGVVARGPGEAVVARIDVEASRGIGIGAEGVTDLSVRDSTVAGSLDADSAAAATAPLPPFSCGSSSLATHGLVVVDVEALTLESFRAEGFAAFGALLVRSGTTWTDGGAAANLGAGVEVWDGSAELTDVTLESTRTGVSAIEAYDGVFGGGASVETTRLVARDGDVYGLFHDGAEAVHHDLVVRDHGFAGVWVQNVSTFEMGGPTTELTGNGFAGLAAIDSTGVAVDQARIAGTVERVTTGGVGTVRAGDGVHFVRSAGTLRQLTLVDNERVGTLLELGGASTDTVTLDAVSVEASGDALGAIAQNGTVEAGWDTGITRLGDTASNDASFTGMLPFGDAVGPPCLPPLGEVDARGIDALITP